MERISKRTRIVAAVILLLAVTAMCWLLSSARQSVELTFVHYEYDSIVFKLANRTSSPLIVLWPNAPNRPDVTFSSFTQYMESHSEQQLCTSREKLIPAMLPLKIDVHCLCLPGCVREPLAC